MAHGFIPVPNCARIEFIYRCNGVIMENVINVQKGSPYTLAQLQSLRATCITWDAAQQTAKQVTGCSLIRVRTKALDTNASPMEDYTLPTPRAGTDNSQALPGNATFAIKLSTGLAGRSFRGRWYVVGIGTVYLGATANQVNTTPANNYVTSLNALQTALASAGHTLGVVSYRHALAWRTTGLFTASTGYVLTDYNMDSMRRRLTGRGS